MGRVRGRRRLALKRPRAAKRAAAPVTPAPPALQGPALAALAALAIAALALFVQRRALGVFFSPDDAIKLERARGLLPAIPFPWRWLTSTAYPGIGSRLFGLAPAPWHAVNLGMHAVCAVLLFAWARALGLSRASAFLAAGLFAGSRLAFSVLHQVVGVEDLAALALVLGAFVALERAARWRTVAGIGLLVAALLCKETVAPLPLVLLLARAGGAPLTERARRTGLALLPSIAMLATLAVAGASTRIFGDGAYASGLGPHVLRNLLVYAAWTVDPVSVSPGVVNTLTPANALAGGAALAALGAIAWFTRRRAPAGAIGALFFLLGLASVLPLLRQVQAHYIYVPLAGFSLALAALLETWVAGAPGRTRVATALALALVAAGAASSERLSGLRFTATNAGSGVPLDPALRKSEALRHLVDDLGADAGGGRTAVAMFLPPELMRGYSARTGAAGAVDSIGLPRYVLAREVSGDGLALRLFLPQVDTVAWVSGWERRLRDARWYLLEAGSHLRPLGRGLAAQESYATLATENGRPDVAAHHLTDVIRDEPANPRIHYLLARALHAMGDDSGARRELSDAARLARDPETAAAVRSALAELAGSAR